MKEQIIHKVKRMGESEYTECGLRFINTGLAATERGEVTCKKCVKLVTDETEDKS